MMGTNLGHRLGKGSEVGPENSITRLKTNIIHQTDPDFKYWEFDINELGDGTIVVFHDRDLDYRGKKYKLKDLSREDFKNMIPYAPTLNELLTEFSTFTVLKPIRVEIKRLLSDIGRGSLLELVEAYHPRS